MYPILIDLDPQPYVWRLAFLGSIFTFMASAVFLLLTGRGRRPELGSGRLSAHGALAVVLPLWLLALGWRYHAEFGGRFYDLHSGRIDEYTLVYAYPTRIHEIRAAEIVECRGVVDWTEKLPGRRIEIKLVGGKTHRSSRMSNHDFEVVSDRLAKAGIHVAAGR
jgi:hypothetical protein